MPAIARSLLGYEQFLVNGVPQREGNQTLPLPAAVHSAVLSDSVLVGAVFLLPAEPL